MASQSDSSVSAELGELLELLNALEAQDSRPLENFATLERLLAAGKGGSAESPSEDHQPDDHLPDDYQRDAHQPDDHQLDDYQLDDHPSEVGFGDGISGATEQSSSEETIAHRPDWREENGPEDDRGVDDKAADERPEAEIENRLAVHIIQGLRKSMKDWAS
jgi:hypothetical protein